jgi:hypothetical protein
MVVSSARQASPSVRRASFVQEPTQRASASSPIAPPDFQDAGGRDGGRDATAGARRCREPAGDRARLPRAAGATFLRHPHCEPVGVGASNTRAAAVIDEFVALSRGNPQNQALRRRRRRS